MGGPALGVRQDAAPDPVQREQPDTDGAPLARSSGCCGAHERDRNAPPEHKEFERLLPAAVMAADTLKVLLCHLKTVWWVPPLANLAHLCVAQHSREFSGLVRSLPQLQSLQTLDLCYEQYPEDESPVNAQIPVLSMVCARELQHARFVDLTVKNLFVLTGCHVTISLPGLLLGFWRALTGAASAAPWMGLLAASGWIPAHC